MKKIRIFTLMLALVLILTSCSKSENKMDESVQDAAMDSLLAKDGYDDAYEDTSNDEGLFEEKNESAPYGEAGLGEDGTGFIDTSGVDFIKNKIIRNAHLSIETESFDETIELIESVISDSEGYVEQSQLDGSKPETAYDAARTARIVIRVPAMKFEPSLKALRKGGEIISESLNTENISTNYRDTLARIESLDTHISNLDILMQKATKIEDMLKIEQEISRLIYEKESLTSNVKQWDDLVGFSTINVELSEVNTIIPEILAPSNNIEFSFADEAKYNFVNAWYGLTGFLTRSVLGLLAYWPIILFLIILASILLWINKRRSKSDKKFGKTRKNRKDRYEPGNSNFENLEEDSDPKDDEPKNAD